MRQRNFQIRNVRRAAAIIIPLIALALLLGVPSCYRTFSHSIKGPRKIIQTRAADPKSPQDQGIEEQRARAFADFDDWTKEFLVRHAPEYLKARGTELVARRRAFLKD